MTREEAIENLKILKEDYWETDDYGYATAECQEMLTALDMAIKALEHEQKDAEISVGDEVMVNDIDRKAVVIGISTFDDWDAPYNILFDNGNTDWVRKDIISKTGKHYSQIEEVLKELRRDEE